MSLPVFKDYADYIENHLQIMWQLYSLLRMEISCGSFCQIILLGFAHAEHRVRYNGRSLALDLHYVKFISRKGYDIHFLVAVAPVPFEYAVAQADEQPASFILASFACRSARVHHSNVTIVTPEPPWRTSSSETLLTPGTVFRYFCISSLSTPVPLP